MNPQELINYLKGMGATSAPEIVSTLENKRALDLLGIDSEYRLAEIEQDWDNERTIYHIESGDEIFRLIDENGYLSVSDWDVLDVDRCLSDYADA